MDSRERLAELTLTRLAREGRTTRQNAPCGEHTMRLAWEDLKAFAMIFPGLMSKNPLEQSAAFDELFASPLSEPFRVARTPAQVRRAPRRPIVVKP